MSPETKDQLRTVGGFAIMIGLPLIAIPALMRLGIGCGGGLMPAYAGSVLAGASGVLVVPARTSVRVALLIIYLVLAAICLLPVALVAECTICTGTPYCL